MSTTPSVNEDSRRQPFLVFVACGNQATRSRWSKCIPLAHLGQLADVSLTISWSRQASIVALGLVDVLSVQVREPGFDSPCRHSDQDSVCRFQERNTLALAGVLQLGPAFCGTQAIAVDHYHQCGRDTVSNTSILCEFLHKPLSNELFRRSASRRTWGYSHVAMCPSHLSEKPPQEYFMLLVFAKQHYACLSFVAHVPPAAHSSHPLATSSDNLRPGSAAPDRNL